MRLFLELWNSQPLDSVSPASTVCIDIAGGTHQDPASQLVPLPHVQAVNAPAPTSKTTLPSSPCLRWNMSGESEIQSTTACALPARIGEILDIIVSVLR